MSDTMFGINDPRACEHYSARMFEDSIAASYFGRNLMNREDQSQTTVQLLTELARQRGDQISFDPSIQIDGAPVDGDNKLEVRIDQVRKVVEDDRVTSPQQAHKLREEALKSLADWYGRFYDQLSMRALSGRPGAVNANLLRRDDKVSLFCNNAFKEPDSDHIVYGGDAKSLDTLKKSDTLTLAKIEALCAYADALGGGGEGVVPLQPFMVNGREYYVLLMHLHSAEDLCESTDPRRWKSIQEAAQKARKEAEAVRSKLPIFKNAFGLIGKVLLHKHEFVPRFNDGGAAKNVEWSRAFLLGRQALIWAFGGAQPGCQFAWWEEDTDYGGKTAISVGTIIGMARTEFNDKACGMIAVDHASKTSDWLARRIAPPPQKD